MLLKTRKNSRNEYSSIDFDLTHLVSKSEQNQDGKVFGEGKGDKGSAHEDPEDEGADQVGGGDALGGAVVQVDQHQKESEQETKPLWGNETGFEYHHLVWYLIWFTD